MCKNTPKIHTIFHCNIFFNLRNTTQLAIILHTLDSQCANTVITITIIIIVVRKKITSYFRQNKYVSCRTEEELQRKQFKITFNVSYNKMCLDKLSL